MSTKFVISEEEFNQIKPKLTPIYIINSKQFKSLTGNELDDKKEAFSFKVPTSDESVKVDYIVLPRYSDDVCTLIEKVINYLNIRFSKVDYAINLAAESGLGMLPEHAEDIEELISQRDSLKLSMNLVYDVIYSKKIGDRGIKKLVDDIANRYNIDWEKVDDIRF